MTEFFQYFF